MPDLIPTPENNRLSKLVHERDLLNSFLKWMESHGIKRARWDADAMGNHGLVPDADADDAVVLRFLGIDPAKLDAERRALLESLW